MHVGSIEMNEFTWISSTVGGTRLQTQAEEWCVLMLANERQGEISTGNRNEQRSLQVHGSMR